MICARHHALARSREHGRAYCFACFVEALEFADRVETERVIARIRGRIKTEFGQR